EHRGVIRSLRTANDGNWSFAIVAAWVALIALRVSTFVSANWAHIKQLETMAVPMRMIAKYGYIALPLLVVSPHLAMLARDACRVALRKLHITRASAALAALAAFGATLSFGYYPLLARQISPKEVFDSFQHFARPGEELAMIGTGQGGGSARYYAHRDVRSFTGEQEAFSWLTESDTARRWL